MKFSSVDSLPPLQFGLHGFSEPVRILSCGLQLISGSRSANGSLGSSPDATQYPTFCYNKESRNHIELSKPIPMQYKVYTCSIMSL